MRTKLIKGILDISYLQKWNGSHLIYYSNEMRLYYNIGKVDKAKEIYEAKIKDYPVNILSKSLTMEH